MRRQIGNRASATGPCTNCTRLDLTCSSRQANDDLAQRRGQLPRCSLRPEAYPCELVLTSIPGKVSRTLPSQSQTEAGTVRKRAQRACHHCHTHKTKCSGDLPACKRCASAGLTCEYMPAKRKFASVPYNTAAQQSGKVETEIVVEDAPQGSLFVSEGLHPRSGVRSTERDSGLDESDVEQLTAE